MTRVTELAKRVQKEANEITGWGFSLVPQEDAYLVGTSLTKKTKYTSFSLTFVSASQLPDKES